MNHQAHSLSGTTARTATGGSKLSLRIVTEHDSEDHTQQLYLAPLQPDLPRRQTIRHLRLKDRLAGGSASGNAAILMRDPGFWSYLQLISLTAYNEEIDVRSARYFINRLCGVRWRQELDQIDTAAERFFQLIERPFLEWLDTGY